MATFSSQTSKAGFLKVFGHCSFSGLIEVAFLAEVQTQHQISEIGECSQTAQPLACN